MCCSQAMEEELSQWREMIEVERAKLSECEEERAASEAEYQSLNAHFSAQLVALGEERVDCRRIVRVLKAMAVAEAS